ncbi:hypothetical protein F25303_11010 [Fusarium sp. NRRL 25303]|nr:hypothetical protein F25303_11010 [Fusarium sp. NRRL 25303]
MASYRPGAGAEYILPHVFPDEEHRCKDPVQRQDQKAKVRAAFEEAKEEMSQQAIAEIYDYLIRGTWIHASERASSHTAYRHFMGKNGRGEPTLYYPEFFVIQAIYPQDRDDPDIHVAYLPLSPSTILRTHWQSVSTLRAHTHCTLSLSSFRDDHRAAINMEKNKSRHTANAKYNLTRLDFFHEISNGDSQWRSTQVDRVLSSFQEAKKIMSTQAIHLIHEYLKSGRWIHDGLTASRHPAYKVMKGHSGGNGGRPLLYYPYFFVIQAIFPSTDALRIVCEDIGRHWGVRISIHEPFYPHLQDSEREMDLIMGKNPCPRGQVEHPSRSPYSPAIFTLNRHGDFDMEDPADSIQVANDNARTSQPVPTSASDTLRNYDEELTKRRIHEAQEKADEIHHHTVLAQQLFKRGQEHADAAVEIAESLLETLNTTKRHIVAAPDDEERSSKRLLEN